MGMDETVIRRTRIETHQVNSNKIKSSRAVIEKINDEEFAYCKLMN